MMMVAIMINGSVISKRSYVRERRGWRLWQSSLKFKYSAELLRRRTRNPSQRQPLRSGTGDHLQSFPPRYGDKGIAATQSRIVSGRVARSCDGAVAITVRAAGKGMAAISATALSRITP